jgi:hypothetical protein
MIPSYWIGSLKEEFLIKQYSGWWCTLGSDCLIVNFLGFTCLWSPSCLKGILQVSCLLKNRHQLLSHAWPLEICADRHEGADEMLAPPSRLSHALVILAMLQASNRLSRNHSHCWPCSFPQLGLLVFPFLSCFFGGELGFELRVLHLQSKSFTSFFFFNFFEVLYFLSHTSSPFFSGYFWRLGSPEIISKAGLEPWSSWSQPPK